MTEYNFYYSSEFKNSNETNNDFNIILDENIIIKEDQSAFLKINDVSFLNSMFNISSHHLNNYIDITSNSIKTRIYIPDGNYSIYTFKDKLNTLLSTYNVVVGYDNIDFTLSYKTTSGSIQLDPCNLKTFLGLSQEIYINTTIAWSTQVDLRSYNKIILTSSLTFSNNPYNNLIGSFSSTSGIGNICCWIERNNVSYSTIEYNNNTDMMNEIADKYIKNINFQVLNEYKEKITDMSTIYLHFSIIVKDNYNYQRKMVKLLAYITDLLKTIYNFIYYWNY